MAYKVFVDGEEGTTGLQIYQRLATRSDVELLRIDSERRKDSEARRELLRAADVAVLCLPDVASREAVTLAGDSHVRIIDASTAFRTDPAWAYGLPELNRSQRDRIRSATRVSVPGCHATGFAVLAYPLIQAGILPKDYPVTCTSISGYSGAGKKLIALYEGPDAGSDSMRSPRPYALGLTHKHLPEMQAVTGIDYPPLFMPLVGNFYSGMVVSIPLHARCLSRKATPAEIRGVYAAHYEGERFIRVFPENAETALDSGFLPATACNGTNRIELFTFGTMDRLAVMARFDNLGKGASGAAVQCMNLMLGVDEGIGL